MNQELILIKLIRIEKILQNKEIERGIKLLRILSTRINKAIDDEFRTNKK